MREVWSVDEFRAAGDRDYERAVTAFVEAHMFHASPVGAKVIEDEEGRWLVARVWSWEQRAFVYERALLPEGVELP